MTVIGIGGKTSRSKGVNVDFAVQGKPFTLEFTLFSKEYLSKRKSGFLPHIGIGLSFMVADESPFVYSLPIAFGFDAIPKRSGLTFELRVGVNLIMLAFPVPYTQVSVGAMF